MTTKQLDVSHYTYRVAWSPEAGEFVATCLEFPSTSWLAATQRDALTGLLDLVSDVVRDMTEQGEAVPEPLPERHYSGKFNLRVGRSGAKPAMSGRGQMRGPRCGAALVFLL